jgi:hypothetical protein
MKDFVKEKCDLMVRNRKVLNKSFVWDFDIMTVATSLILAGAGVEADAEKLKNCKKILRKGVGCFSSIRGIGETITVCKMAMSEDPAKYVSDLKKVYDKIMKGRFFNGEYMVLAAANVCDNGKVSEIDSLVGKFNEIDKRMKEEHPILTSAEDWSLAMLLAMTDKSVDQIIGEMEQGFDYMRDMRFRATQNGLQSLTQVLALMGGDMKTKCDKVIRFSDKFREKGVRYGKDCEIAALGTLLDIDANEDELVSEIFETADYLKKQKGFGSWHLDKKTRLMFASLIVAESYEKNDLTSAIRPHIEVSAITSASAVAIAATIAMMLVIYCCCASASSH